MTAVILAASVLAGPPMGYPTYFRAAEVADATVDAVGAQVEQALSGHGLTVVGKYHPASNPDQLVVAYTAAELLDAARAAGGLTAFGVVLRVGIEKTPAAVEVSYLNPDYLLRAYYRSSFPSAAAATAAVHARLSEALAALGTAKHEAFGSRTEDGAQEPDKTEKELLRYHYMAMMPYFEDVVELASFSSMEAGRAKIESALAGKRGGATSVYAVEVPGGSAVLYGVGLGDPRTGEAHFLPIINRVETHVAAMPYELLLYQDGAKAKAVMLHGRYRIALHWNALTMGTFMKIMGTPDDVRSTLAGLVSEP